MLDWDPSVAVWCHDPRKLEEKVEDTSLRPMRVEASWGYEVTKVFCSASRSTSLGMVCTEECDLLSGGAFVTRLGD